MGRGPWPRWWTVLLGLVLAACSAAGPRSNIPSVSQRVAVLAVDKTPTVELDGFSGGRVEGFAQGLGNTFVGCFQSLGSGACVNSGCGAAVLFLLGVCGTASVVGGIAGAVNTEGDVARRAAASGIGRTLDTSSVQRDLRDRVVVAGKARDRQLESFAATLEIPQAMAKLRADGVDILLEVELVRVGTAGPGDGAPSRLFMESRARLMRVKDGRELAVGNYRVEGASYSLYEWRANRGNRLREGFSSAYDALAEKIVGSLIVPAE